MTRLATAILVLAALQPAAAAPEVVTEHVRARLVSELGAVPPGRSSWVMLHLQIRDGWHTYWRNPGDSGEAPSIDWQLPAGFDAGDIVWPHPERIPAGPFANYGYAGDAYHLVELSAPATLAAGDTVTLAARARWLVCEEICIPEEGSFALELPAAAEPDPNPAAAPLFAAARAALPLPSPWPVSFTATADRFELRAGLPAAAAASVSDALFFAAEYGRVEHAAEQPLRSGSDGLTLSVPRAGGGPAPARLDGVLVLTEQLADGPVERAFRVRAAAAGGAAGNEAPGPAPGPAATLLLAALGGLLLNLMPCVFPVLSIKALGLVEQARQAPREARRHGLVFTAGVLVTMTALAATLLALRAAGEQIGWGFQLQSPPVVMVLAWLMFALGLMMSGLWSFGAGLAGLGHDLSQRPGYGGSFFTGLLAVVAATPCTAPFMGTALGVAVTLPALAAIAVFLALGAGLAAPWLALAVWPALGRLLPRPGRWMETLRELLAFPLYASGVWLVWVLAQQAGADGVAVALGGMVLIGLTAWVASHWPARAAPAVAAGVLALAALGFALPRAPAAIAVDGAAAERYTPERLAEARRDGRPVFVNLTAAWCITCLVNERVALGTQGVARRMREKDVVYLKGDWTQRDATITVMLERFGRSGVPLYLLYPAEADAPPQVLPQILTEALVLERLARL